MTGLHETHTRESSIYTTEKKKRIMVLFYGGLQLIGPMVT